MELFSFKWKQKIISNPYYCVFGTQTIPHNNMYGHSHPLVSHSLLSLQAEVAPSLTHLLRLSANNLAASVSELKRERLQESQAASQ